MKKSIKYILIILVFLLMLSSCGTNKVVDVTLDLDNPSEIEVANIEYEDFYIVRTYKNGKKDKVNLKPSMISDYEKLKFYQPGNQTIIVKYMGAKLELKLNITRQKLDVDFICDPVVYDGKSHELEISGYIPNDATIVYPYGKSFKDVGNHNVKAIISCPNYETTIIVGELVITPAIIDLSNVVFDNQSFTYDGAKKKIKEIDNLPSNVSVSYLVDGEEKDIIDAGEYDVTAVFKVNDNQKNYFPINPITAKYTVEKSIVDYSNISIGEQVVYYTGNEYEWKIVNELPDWIKVSYENNKKTNVDIYYDVVVTLKIENSNYHFINDDNEYCDEVSIPFEVEIILAE